MRKNQRTTKPIYLLGCDGAFGCGCPEKREVWQKRQKNLRGHGSRRKYNRGCRCYLCKRANRIYMREYNRRKREERGNQDA